MSHAVTTLIDALERKRKLLRSVIDEAEDMRRRAVAEDVRAAKFRKDIADLESAIGELGGDVPPEPPAPPPIDLSQIPRN